MSALTATAMVLPALTVYAALRRPWRGGGLPLPPAFAVCLSPSIGLGLASCLYFILLLAEIRRPVALRVDVLLWLGALVAIAADNWRRSAVADRSQPAAAPTDRTALAMAAVGAAALCAIAAYAFWVHATLRPHGEWDAWAIWNLRARALLRGAPDWASVFSNQLAWSNVDYPLLVPVTVARLWAFEGAETTIVPAIVAFTFFASTVATVIVLVGQANGWVSGLLSGAVLVAPHTYVFQGSCQCADIPIAQFVLIAVACAAMARTAGENRALIVIAGASTGLAAWTKNEGQLLFVAVLIGLAAWPRRQRYQAWGWFAAGATPPLAAVLWFKLRLAPSNYLFGPAAIDSLVERLRDTERWAVIRTQLTEMVPAWGEIPGGALLILCVVVALTVRVGRCELRRCGFGLSVIVLMMIGYILVYAITPLPLLWQILTSFPRLMAQLWPAIVWSLFQLSSAGAAGRRPPTTA